MLDPVAEGGSLFIPFFHTAERSLTAIERERASIKSHYQTAIALQLLMYGSFLIASPGYILPFCNHPTARVCALAIFCLQAFGILIHWKVAPVSTWNRIAFYVYCVVFGFIPGFLLPVIGPAIVTIMNCCGACRFG
jgi:hypothetical protein